MRDFSWKVFAMTGDVESYLLYTEACNSLGQELDNAREVIEDEEAEE
ncbi:YqzL family protein [Paenibacillus polymyxa]|nr:YqzL family protein [Paenibacillus polymyxa]MBT2285423.1 YqzL family protein [Paenibacillus polymyxa]